MSSPTIAAQVSDFNTGFTAAIGPELSAVFDKEQNDLRAAGVPSHVVREGDTVPDATLLDADGNEVQLASVLGGKPAVIVFYRGAWCPYCNLTLKSYQQELLPVLRERGYGFIAISPQTPEGSSAAIANGGLEFDVLSDAGGTLISELGIDTEPSGEARAAHTKLGFDVADSNADATAGIPFPTVLVVDGSRAVTFADIQVDYTSRTEVADVVAALS